MVDGPVGCRSRGGGAITRTGRRPGDVSRHLGITGDSHHDPPTGSRSVGSHLGRTRATREGQQLLGNGRLRDRSDRCSRMGRSGRPLRLHRSAGSDRSGPGSGLQCGRSHLPHFGGDSGDHRHTQTDPRKSVRRKRAKGGRFGASRSWTLPKGSPSSLKPPRCDGWCSGWR